LLDFQQLPPIYLNAAGLDCLRDDSVRLAARLAEAGVGCRLDVVPGVVHGFMQMSRGLPAAAKAQDKAGAWIKEHVC
jgi:acetyl esterase